MQVLAERAGRDGLLQGGVGGRDQAHVDLDRLRAAQPLELALLQDPQQLDLGRRVQVADLVQEQRAPLGELESPLLARLGAGERAPLVAEQLRLDERVGQRGAAHLDERLPGPRRVVVDGVGDELLAGPRLAAHEHRGVGRRHLRDLGVDLPHGAAGADDVGEVVALLELAAQVDVLLGQPLALGVDEVVDADGLGDHGRDHVEELDVALVVAPLLERQVDADGPHRLLALAGLDGDADEADVAPVEVLAAGPVEEHRLLAGPRHDDRLRGLDDPARHPFADGVAGRAPLRGQPLGRLHVQEPRVGVQQRDRSAHDAVAPVEELHHPLQGGPQAGAAREGVVHLGQRLEPLDVRRPVSSRHVVVRPRQSAAGRARPGAAASRASARKPAGIGGSGRSRSRAELKGCLTAGAWGAGSRPSGAGRCPPRRCGPRRWPTR